MNKLQRLIYNNGERLVPYISHDEAELVRHRSSYAFFHGVISHDLQARSNKNNLDISVVDLGFGSGYGCSLLCSLPGSRITGVDIGPECEIFARQYYSRSNICYITKDLTQFVPEMAEYDYVVSRGVLEHVPNGLDLIKRLKFNNRVMIDVPYDEAPGNEHHVLTGIREEDFSHYGDCEIFYEDLDGIIYDAAGKPSKPNMIMIVINAPGIPKVSTFMDFPIPAERSDRLEEASRINIAGTHYYFDSPNDLLFALEKAVKETEVVADIGCGVVPMNYFRPKLHLMVEPFKEYTDILSYRHAGDKSVIILRNSALDALRAFSDNSVDSIFLLDVIEHLEKDEGMNVIAESERVAREQIIIFTPLGFMPQHMNHGEADGWGLSGADFQKHRSGWLPEDFSTAWSFYICDEFHWINHKGKPLDKPFGAFFAIRNFEHKTHTAPEKLPDFRRTLPVEKALQDLQTEHQHLQAYCAYLKESNEALLVEYQQLLSLSQQQQKQLADCADSADLS